MYVVCGGWAKNFVLVRRSVGATVVLYQHEGGKVPSGRREKKMGLTESGISLKMRPGLDPG